MISLIAVYNSFLNSLLDIDIALMKITIACFCPPLYYAVKNLQYNAAKLLIDNGADVNMLIVDMDCPNDNCDYIGDRDCCHDVCLLHVAVSYNDVNMVRLLIDSGAKMPYNCKGGSLVNIAIYHNNHDMASLLYECGMNDGLGFYIRREKCDSYGEWHYHDELWSDVELSLLSDLSDLDMIEIVAKHQGQYEKNVMLAIACDEQVDISIIERLLHLGARSDGIIEKATYYKTVYDVLIQRST
jgi:ankyrin repeat protein